MADLSAMHAALEPFEKRAIGRFEYRSALALAEAIVPGSRSLAAADETTVARAEEMLAAFYPALAGPWRRLDAFRKATFSPADIVWTSYHPLGTCTMGRDPKTSVVDTSHETHDLRGLFIVDGSTVPVPPGVNPQPTIMAMATRAAEKIAERI
jgi:choline dehydrogenase-like flavoprotein